MPLMICNILYAAFSILNAVPIVLHLRSQEKSGMIVVSGDDKASRHWISNIRSSSLKRRYTSISKVDRGCRTE